MRVLSGPGNTKGRVERPTVAVEVEGRCVRQRPGAELFGMVRLRLEPLLAPKREVVLEDAATVLDQSSREYAGEGIEAFKTGIEGGLRDAFYRREHDGRGVCGLKITLLGMVVHPVDSKELAFRYAAADALERGLPLTSLVPADP